MFSIHKGCKMGKTADHMLGETPKFRLEKAWFWDPQVTIFQDRNPKPVTRKSSACFCYNFFFHLLIIPFFGNICSGHSSKI